ncbi:MAG: carboxypeptidase regulatory-like domain-containing protein [Chthoniobacteraceae bacterium]
MPAFRPIILFALALLCAAVPLRAQSNVGESAAFAFDTRDYTTGLAAESATFAFDTRVMDGLSGADVSGTFVLNTSFASAPPLNVIGTVRDTSGVALGGVSIALKRYETVFWQGTSSGGGTFSASNLSPWTYAVVATKTGYVTSITALPANAGGNLPFQVTMTPLPPAPTAIDVVRTPAQTATRAGPNTSDPAYPVLERYDGSQLVYDLTGLDPSRMTVVITHGWVPTIGGDYATALDWAKTLAYLIYNHHPGLAQPPNILVWDWRHKANTLSPQVDDAAEEGLELGKALQQALGANYSQHVHFIGHSLGTIVNRYACDYVHGSLGYNNPPTKWLAVQTQPHFTLLDEAEIATVVGQQVITNAVQGYKVAQLQGAVLAATVTAVSDWKYPIPKDAVWVDNYISAFGIQHSAAVNICLPAEALASGNPITAHSYAHL